MCVCFLRDWEPPRRLHARVCDKASMVLARGPGARAGGMKLKFSIEGEKKKRKRKSRMDGGGGGDGGEGVCGTGRNKG